MVANSVRILIKGRRSRFCLSTDRARRQFRYQRRDERPFFFEDFSSTDTMCSGSIYTRSPSLSTITTACRPTAMNSGWGMGNDRPSVNRITNGRNPSRSRLISRSVLQSCKSFSRQGIGRKRTQGTQRKGFVSLRALRSFAALICAANDDSRVGFIRVHSESAK